MHTPSLPVIVIGAGPVGLAAAAHLLERGMTPLVLEAGASVAATFTSTAHVQLFSPWRYNIDRAARKLLQAQGWQEPAGEALPTAGEMVRDYLQPLAQVPAITQALRLEHRVTRIVRRGMDKVKTKGRDQAPFAVRAMTPAGEMEFLAQAVIDASGTCAQPNPLGADGLPAFGETALAARIAYGMPDIAGTQRARYAGKRILVAGAGHSAAGNLLALATLAEQEAGTQIVWAIRGAANKSYGGGTADQLPARGQLGQRLKQLRDSGRLEVQQHFHTHALREAGGKIEVEGLDGQSIAGIDEIIVATGSRPDLGPTRELRLRLDPWLESTDALAPLIDPNEHSCGTVRPHGHRELAHPEAGYYAVGAKSYGRAPNFLMATGYEQVRSIAAALAGDMAAADDVQLDLPETGVCSARAITGDEGSSCCGPAPATVKEKTSSCCGGPAKELASACCVRDEEIKQAGGSGCGSTKAGCGQRAA